MLAKQRLAETLRGLHRKGYKNYHQIKGTFELDFMTLYIDHVQGDPFAEPSAIRVGVAQTYCQIHPSLVTNPTQRLAVADFFLRRLAHYAACDSKAIGSGKGGLVTVQIPSQAILETTAVLILKNQVEFRLQVGLPADGRRILGHEAARLLLETLTSIITKTCQINTSEEAELADHVRYLEDYMALRNQLKTHGLSAFVADGSRLARNSGDSDLPLGDSCIPSMSPSSLAMTLERPHRGPLRGLAIKKGICLIVGGGYHGKSTLLNAISAGVYPHIPGDGREWVITDPEATQIQAEDGRSIQSLSIAPFLDHLPGQQSTMCFSTSNASGSSSQAASLREALEVDVRTILIDEDNAASNFMGRDARMQALIANDLEPITPLSEFIHTLQADFNVSFVMVMGASSLFFEVATQVIALVDYQIQDYSEKCQTVVDTMPRSTQSAPTREQRQQLIHPSRRSFKTESLATFSQDKRWSIKTHDPQQLRFGRIHIDLQALHHIRHPDQTRAMAWALKRLLDHLDRENRPFTDCLQFIKEYLQSQGLQALCPHPSGRLAGFRICDLAAFLNRLRIPCFVQTENHEEID